MTVRVVCVGSAAQDVFLTGKVFTPECEAGVCYEHLKLGDKLSVDEAIFATGGNAMNAAVTFARQDIDTSFVGLIGDDPAAQAILNVLDDESVHTEHVVSDSNFKTSYSVILLAPNGERTILNRHGESLSTKAEIVTDKSLKADWLYISSVGSMEVLADIVSRAKKLGTKVAFNPASFELGYPQECADIFTHIDLLALNKDEAQIFVEGDTPAELARALSESVDYVLVSDGPRGAVATDGTKLYTAGLYEDVPVIDRTGAGDAFTSGFISVIATGGTVEEALVFASANSTSVVGKIGAKAGILHADTELKSMEIKALSLDDK